MLFDWMALSLDPHMYVSVYVIWDDSEALDLDSGD